jgi:hypothetical protein
MVISRTVCVAEEGSPAGALAVLLADEAAAASGADAGAGALLTGFASAFSVVAASGRLQPTAMMPAKRTLPIVIRMFLASIPRGAKSSPAVEIKISLTFSLHQPPSAPRM